MLYVDRFLDSADASKKAESKTVQATLTASRECIQRLTQDKVRLFLYTASGFLTRRSMRHLLPRWAERPNLSLVKRSCHYLKRRKIS